MGEPDQKTPGYTSNLCLELLCHWPDPPRPWHAGLPADVSRIPEDRFWVMFTSLPRHDVATLKPLLDRLAPVAEERARYLTPGGGGAALLFERRTPLRRSDHQDSD